MLAILSLITVLVFSLISIKIATIALCHTGLSQETASFQARSAFTGVGFTTSESEQIMNHPVRRKILSWLIVIGNAGIITGISTVILTMTNIEEHGTYTKIIFLVASIGIIWFVSSSKWIDYYISGWISHALKKYTSLDVKDYNNLLRLANDYRVTELIVEQVDWIVDRQLMDTKLRDEGILVLGIQRNNDFIGAPNGTTKILNGDVLILYGRVSSIQELDKRKKGKDGDLEHAKAVVQQQQIEGNLVMENKNK